MNESRENLFEIVLGRTPKVPIPPSSAPVETWNDYVRDLERQDPEAFELLAVLFNSGIRIPARAEEMTGGQK